MLVHPQFSPVAFSVGPFSLGGMTLGPLEVRWYGLMYLLGFVLFVVLGRWRANRNLLTGWHPRDVDDDPLALEVQSLRIPPHALCEHTFERMSSQARMSARTRVTVPTSVVPARGTARR